MLNLNEIIEEAINDIEEVLESLNDFAENEGHDNIHVMTTVANRIGHLELELENLKKRLTI